MSRIPMTSRTTLKSAENVPPLPKTFSRLPNRGIVRRSKSFSDLRSTATLHPFVTKQTVHPLVTKPTLNPLATKQTTTTSAKPKTTQVCPPQIKGTKRPAPTAAGNTQKKPTRKIPDWDYKTRFTILKEDHKKLVDEHKETCERLSEETRACEEFRKCNETLSKFKNNVENETAQLKKQVLELSNQNKTLETMLEVERKMNKQLQESNELLSQHKIENEKEIVSLKEHIKELTNQNEVLENTVKDNKQQILVLQEETSNLTSGINELKATLNNCEIKRRQLHNEIQDLKGNIRVFCRLRPPSEQELFNQTLFNVPNEKTLEIPGNRESIAGGRTQRGHETQEFCFDKVFSQEATQQDIFDELSQLVQSALDGYHVCVFAYGQTGSGKTHTMLGEQHPEKLGMIPRSVKLIFDIKKGMESHGWTYQIHASFLEIYNENVQDLLNNKNGKPLDIRFNDGKGTTVSNLTVVELRSPQDFKEYLQKAQQNRFTAATNFNERSSRSHAVTKIYIEGFNGNDTTLTGSVSLIDLAGSESAKFSADERLKETKHINKSLTCLGNVLMSLNRRDNHIPYRDSKLTFLLQSSLGGNCKCLMIANISPNNDFYNETLNVLRFATKVKEVKTNVSRNRAIVQSK